MRQDVLRKWIDENESDAQIMMLLKLNINQYRNRMAGITPFTPLEVDVLMNHTGLTAEELGVKE